MAVLSHTTVNAMDKISALKDLESNGGVREKTYTQSYKTITHSEKGGGS